MRWIEQFQLACDGTGAVNADGAFLVSDDCYLDTEPGFSRAEVIDEAKQDGWLVTRRIARCPACRLAAESARKCRPAT